MAISAADLMVTFKSDTSDAEAGMKRMNKGITGFSSALAKGGALAAAGVLGAGFFAAKIGIPFEREMANVNSILQVSDDQLAKYSQDILDMSVRTAQAPNDLAASLYDIASSGFTGADGLKVVEAAANAATAGMTTADVSGAALAATLNAYGQSADMAGRNSDILFQIVKDGVLTFPQLANNMGNVLPIASSLGISLEEVGAAYAQMTLQGVNASAAETQIGSLMRSILNPTDALTNAVQAHGYATAQAALESEGFSGFLKILNDTAGDNKQALFDMLGTQEAMNAATILGKDGAKAYDAELKKMKNSSKGVGATQAALEKQMKSSAFQIQRAKAALQVLAIQGFGLFAPLVARGASALTGFLTKGVIPFTKAIGSAFKGGFAFDKMLTQLPQPLRRAAHAVGVMAEAIGDMIRRGVSKGELTQFFHGFQAFGEELSQGVHVVANIIIDAAVSLGSLLLDGVKAAPGAIFNWVRGKLFGGPTGDATGGPAPYAQSVDAGVWDVAVALGKLILNGAAGAIGDLWGWVRSQIVGGGGSVSQDPASPMYGQGGQTVSVGSVIISAAAAIGGELLTASQNLTDWIKGKINWPADGTFDFGSITLKGTVTAQDTDGAPAGNKAGKDTIDRYVQSIKNNLQPVHDAGIQIASYLFGGIGTGIGLAAGAMTTIAGAIILGIVTAIKDPTQLSQIGVGINDAIKGAINITVWSFGNFDQIVSSFYTNLRNAFNVSGPDLSFITDKLFGGGGASQDPASPMYGGPASAGLFSNLGTTLQTALTTAIAAFTPDVGDVGTKITTAIGTAWVGALTTFTIAFKPDFNFIGTAIQGALDAIPHPTLPSWLSDLGWITEKINALTGKLGELTSLAGKVAGAGGDVVNPRGENGGGGGVGFQNLSVYRPNTDGAATGGGAQQTLPAMTLPAVDATAFTASLASATAAAQAFAAQTFTAKLAGDNGQFAQAYTAAFGWGTVFAAQDFQATLSADNGPAAIAYTNAFGWGATWAAQVFTASFAIDVSGLYAAQAVAYQVAANIAAVMPHSPAKRGPLSKPIRFTFIADAARRDLSGLGNQIEGYLGANGRRRVGARGLRSGGNITVNNVLKSKELIRWIQNSEEGASFARGLGRELGLSGGF